MRVAIVLVLAACNPVFGLDKTDLMAPIDAQYFDAPADAPWACPAPGVEPLFQSGFNQVTEATECIAYMLAPDVGKAIGWCNRTQISEGAIGEPLVSSTLSPIRTGTFLPRISPDGEILHVENGVALTIDVYKRQTDGTWLFTNKPIEHASYRNISNATRGPERRVVQTDFVSNAFVMNELVEQSDGSWLVTATNPLAMSPVSQSPLTLSGDGLTVSFLATIAVNKAADVIVGRRMSTSEPFSYVVVSTAPEGIITPYLSEDCGRLYFSGLGAVFFLDQR